MRLNEFASQDLSGRKGDGGIDFQVKTQNRHASSGADRPWRRCNHLSGHRFSPSSLRLFLLRWFQIAVEEAEHHRAQIALLWLEAEAVRRIRDDLQLAGRARGLQRGGKFLR